MLLEGNIACYPGGNSWQVASYGTSLPRNCSHSAWVRFRPTCGQTRATRSSGSTLAVWIVPYALPTATQCRSGLSAADCGTVGLARIIGSSSGCVRFHLSTVESLLAEIKVSSSGKSSARTLLLWPCNAEPSGSLEGMLQR